MGDLIHMHERRAGRRGASQGRRPPATCRFYFDLSCPFSYVAAERVEVAFDVVTWIPASALTVEPIAVFEGSHRAGARLAAQRRAAALRLGLVWPESWPAPVPGAMRAAAYAAEAGRGAAFVLAAGRLAFCGGFDLDEPDVLAEAAGAAGLDAELCLAAASDLARDAGIERAGLELVSAGVHRLPALRVGDRHFCGEGRVEEAAAARRAIVS